MTDRAEEIRAEFDEKVSRRNFMQAGATSLLALSSGGSGIDLNVGDVPQESVDEYAFQGVADLMGPIDAKPAPDSDFFDNKAYFAYRYEATDVDYGGRYFITQDDSEWTELSMIPTNQLDEVQTQNARSFFNHTFARPEAPDTKNWEFTDADLTKDGSEIELASTTFLETTQRGNYPPGSSATPGVALRVTSEPTAGEAYGGYFDPDNGGLVGEDTTDSFVELRKGGTAKRVHRTDWNGYRPDERVWVNNRPVITRMPHLFYGGGDFKIEALLHREDGSELRTLHTFTPDNVDDTFVDGPPMDQPNLPVRFESDSLSGGALRANACHYQFSLSETENRVNGEHFSSISVPTDDWVPLLSWRKRTNWEMVNVRPLAIGVTVSGANVKLELQLDPTLSDANWRLPTNTSSSETAVEVDVPNEGTTDTTISTDGERRWPGSAVAGQGSQPGSLSAADLTFNLPADQIVSLTAQAVGSSATVEIGQTSWEEYF